MNTLAIDSDLDWNTDVPVTPNSLAMRFLEGWCSSFNRLSIYQHRRGPKAGIDSSKISFAQARKFRHGIGPPVVLVVEDKMDLGFGDITMRLVERIRREGFNALQREDWPMLITGLTENFPSNLEPVFLRGDAAGQFDRYVNRYSQCADTDELFQQWEKWLGVFDIVRTGIPTLKSGDFRGLRLSPLGQRILMQCFFPLTISQPLFHTASNPIGLLNCGPQGLYFAVALSPTQAVVSLPQPSTQLGFCQLPSRILANFVNTLVAARSRYIFADRDVSAVLSVDDFGWQNQPECEAGVKAVFERIFIGKHAVA
ncbi:MAG: hypothetical protein ABI905_13455 [Betaproteobacteria bacterium]